MELDTISEREPLNKPLYPWFGSKRRVADVIWEAFGDVRNFVDPFMGTCSVLLTAPWPAKRTETVNDLDGFIVNAWRSIQYSPEETAKHADWIVSEHDLTARHYWLVTEGRKIISSGINDPKWHHPEIAGWWLWGQCCWIGSGWCAENSGGWSLDEDMQWVRSAGQGVNRKLPHLGDAGQGVNRKLPHLGDAGQGVNRQLPHLGDAGKGVNRQRPHLGDAGKGVNRQLPHLGNAGQGVNRQRPHLGDAGKGHRDRLVRMFSALADRLRYVRICCGDWTRVLGPSVTTSHGLTAVILDPPYSSNRTDGCYAMDSLTVSNDVRKWALENGDNPKLRIALCGHDGEHDMPDTWPVHKWSATGGYSGASSKDTVGKENKHKERIWFSPHCLSGKRDTGTTTSLF